MINGNSVVRVDLAPNQSEVIKFSNELTAVAITSLTGLALVRLENEGNTKAFTGFDDDTAHVIDSTVVNTIKITDTVNGIDQIRVLAGPNGAKITWLASDLDVLSVANSISNNTSMVVSEVDKYTHDGYAFYSRVEFTVPAGGTVYTAITTPDNYDIHMKDRSLRVISQSIQNKEVDVSLEVYEDSTVDAGSGTAIPVLNSNRNSVNTSNIVEHRLNPTSVIEGFDIGVGNRLKAAANEDNNIPTDREYIMKKDSTYVAKITNLSTLSDAVVILFWSWYEI